MPAERRPSRGKPARSAGESRGAAGSGRGGSGRRDERSSPRRGPRDGRSDAPRGGDRDRRVRADGAANRSAEQERYDGPPLPEDITGAELDRNVTAQLKGLPEKLAARVARHLAAAGMLVDEDPQTAYQHTLAARARAARVAVVREACGEAAYAAGEFAEALSELRAAKRMNGVTDYLPMMADCERALGRPDKALELAKSPSVARFRPELKAEMTIVEAGARRDRGEVDAALRTLELAPLSSNTREDWVVRLRYAYADTLAAAGRGQEALEWFHRTEAIDNDQVTDAGDRAATLERSLDAGTAGSDD